MIGIRPFRLSFTPWQRVAFDSEVDLRGSVPTQTEDPDTGQVVTDFELVRSCVPAKIEPDGRSPVPVVVGGDPSTIERWIVSLPHGTALAKDEHIDVRRSTNPALAGARFVVSAEIDSGAAAFRQVQAKFVNRGG